MREIMLTVSFEPLKHSGYKELYSDDSEVNKSLSEILTVLLNESTTRGFGITVFHNFEASKESDKIFSKIRAENILAQLKEEKEN